MSLIKCGVSFFVREPCKRSLIYPIQKFYSTKKVDSEEKEVYYGALAPQIRGVKVFSLMTSIAGVIAQPVLYQQVSSVGGGMPMTIALGSFVGFFTFVTPFLLHTITKKYVTRIVYNEKDDTYTATTFSFLLQQKHVRYQVLVSKVYLTKNNFR